MREVEIFSQIRSLISKLCQQNDFLYYSLRKINRWRVYLFGSFNSVFRTYTQLSDVGLSVERVLWVNPDKISHCCETSSNKFLDAGKILSGDWDQHLEPFEKYTGIMSAMRDSYILGNAFQETDFYTRKIDRIENGKIVAGCRSKADYDKRVIRLKELFDDIRENGYKTQDELAQSMKFDGIDINDYVTVHIDRNGHFLFADGQHRLAIAKLLEIESIPVRVAIRHVNWVKFRKKILDTAETGGGKIYQTVSHPDLNDIPAFNLDDRIQIIIANLPFESGSVLDIGAHWGYFGDQLEKKGFECFAVEQDPVHRYFLKKLKIAQKNHFTIVPMSIFDYMDRTEFDIVLALNVFHHFIKTEVHHGKLIELLERLNMRSMFFEPHRYEEFENKGYFRNYGDEEFADFILKHSCLSRKILLGKAYDDRSIYRLDF